METTSLTLEQVAEQKATELEEKIKSLSADFDKQVKELGLQVGLHLVTQISISIETVQ